MAEPEWDAEQALQSEYAEALSALLQAACPKSAEQLEQWARNDGDFFHTKGFSYQAVLAAQVVAAEYRIWQQGAAPTAFSTGGKGDFLNWWHTSGPKVLATVDDTDTRRQGVRPARRTAWWKEYQQALQPGYVPAFIEQRDTPRPVMTQMAQELQDANKTMQEGTEQLEQARADTANLTAAVGDLQARVDRQRATQRLASDYQQALATVLTGLALTSLSPTHLAVAVDHLSAHGFDRSLLDPSLAAKQPTEGGE